MRSYGKATPRRSARVTAWGVVLATVVSGGISTATKAAERRFLVMLANSPKQFGAAQQPASGLPKASDIERQYFDKSDTIGSFAEYWEEISYGDVTVSGMVTDWIELPWAIVPQGQSPANFLDMNGQDGGLFRYGVAERFDNSEAMIIVDTNGDPNNVDDGPFDRGPGGGDVTSQGRPVWMPGQRFLDIDGDGKWDGLDEANNEMDFDGDGAPDLLGPWIDLDGDGAPANAGNCTYLEDTDNDGNPDCCPNGPGNPGCKGFPNDFFPTGLGMFEDRSCPPTSWTLPPPFAVDILDCNGNLIPDVCDVAPTDCISPACIATGWPGPCGGSQDQLPFESGTAGCAPGPGNGIPDECEFAGPSGGGPPFPCVTSSSADPTDPCFGFDVCVAAPRTVVPRCEFDDSNNNMQLDVPEPYEAFLRGGNHRAMDFFGDPKPGFVLDDQYIRDNYPGDADLVINQSKPKQLAAKHDPMSKLVGRPCKCADGTACQTIFPFACVGDPSISCSRNSDCPNLSQVDSPCRPIAVLDTCIAGEFLPYTPPDRWFDVGTTKMIVDPDPGNTITKFTPEPFWYRNAWADRYDCPNCSPPPSWSIQFPDRNAGAGVTPPAGDNNDLGNVQFRTFASGAIPRMIPFPATDRRFFKASRGGLDGRGTGWTGGGGNDVVEFRTERFEDAFPTAQILPEEMNGMDMPLLIFDGFVEHDDLPSSKYHQAGDQRLGEVTSPFGNNIWGEDLAPTITRGDGFIEAAGPLAKSVHGALSTDGGNLLTMELLTWRTQAPFNTGKAWEGQYNKQGFSHPYAGPSGSGPAGTPADGFGFRDYNLDGLLDQGEVRPPGSENYVEDANPQLGLVPGTQTAYPWNRQRLLEDCVEALDSIVDFDDFIDTASLDAVNCLGGTRGGGVPPQYGTQFISPEGIVSGIVFLPTGAHRPGDFLLSPSFFPIHNEDNDNPAKVFPPIGTGETLHSRERISWNLKFHDLVIELSDPRSSEPFLTSFTAHEYLHAWEGFPDLYDYDIFKNEPGVVVNTPVGQWDIMAGSGAVPINLVHPVPILKERRCTRWIKPVDLTTVLTPGVDKTIVLPPAEFVRDDSYYFFENDSRLGERFYFWSAGNGFDQNMPGSGVLVLHTDVGSNPEALPNLQGNGTRFTFVIVQADGDHDLEGGITPFGDAGDPWPGTSGHTRFDCNTNPASQWYSLNACTGLSVVDVATDAFGAAAVTFNWQPTSIPSLSFLDPPGGTSVNKVFQIRFRAADLFGGTTIKLMFLPDRFTPPGQSEVLITDQNLLDNLSQANLVTIVAKTTPGTTILSGDWNITALPDGRYFLFAELVPGPGKDGTERTNTPPRPGRNNIGNGNLGSLSVDVTNARTETWVAECVSADGQNWVVTSTLTQPPVEQGDPIPASSMATLGTPYSSLRNAVTFTILGGSIPFTIGDTFTFTTTGVTPLSPGVIIVDGRISENPTAVIVASPLTGKSGVKVSFDGRRSVNPTGRALNFSWDFGDGSGGSGDQTTHTFLGNITFTVVLTVQDPLTVRFGQTSVDIVLANNSPKASIKASPLSGPMPLTVDFNGSASTDVETPSNQLLYEWDFGDGSTASSSLVGDLVNVSHFYTTAGLFTAALTVTDGGGKSATDTVQILVGNTFPVPVITHGPTRGQDGFEVVFNAIKSFDADDDALEVTWDWNDGTTSGPFPLTGPAGVTDGSVAHVFNLRSGETSSTFRVTAVISETKAGGVSVMWPGVDVILFEAAVGISDPFAKFTLDPDPPVFNEAFTADGSGSFDRPGGNPPASFAWDWGDGSSATGVTATHTYTTAGSFTIVLTVKDGETPPNANSASRTVVVQEQPGEGEAENLSPVASFTVDPLRGPAGSEFRFDARASSDPEGGSLTFQWDFGDGADGSGAQVVHVYELPGSYVVRLSVRDDKNATASVTKTVEVTDVTGNRPPRAIIGTGRRSGAVPLRLTFNAQNSFDPDNDPLTYVWEVRRGNELIETFTGAIAVVTFDEVGEFTISLTVNDGRSGIAVAGPETITVTEQPALGENEPEQTIPGQGPAPLPQRPGAVCGLGMVMGLFASLFGLVTMVVSRRRFCGWPL